MRLTHAAVQDVADRVGVKIDWGTHPNDVDYEYDGTKINANGTELELVLHEIAHFQIASPERRVVPDYGLGQGPGSMECAPMMMTGEDSMVEESLVCALNVLWVAHFDGNLAIVDTLGLRIETFEFERDCLELARLGLIDMKGVPIARVVSDRHENSDQPDVEWLAEKVRSFWNERFTQERLRVP